jgi:ribose transport system substrate-binding protein
MRLDSLISTLRSRAVILVACGLAASALALGACGGDDDDDGGEDAAQEQVSLAVLMASLGDGYTRNLNDSITEQAEAMGAEVQTFDATFDPQKQLQQCQDAIVTQRFQAFVIQPVAGPSMVPCATQAIDAGITVVAVSNPIGPDVDTTEPQVEGLTATILESPGTMGRTLAELTVEACEGKDPCQVIYEFGPPDFSFAANTREVFNEAVAEDPMIEVVGEGSHLFEPDRARSLTSELLTANPDVDVITSDDDPSAAALLSVVEEMGLQNQIAIIGGAGAREGAELVASGEMFGSSVLVPRTAGTKAAEIAITAARGEDPGETEFNNAEDLSPIGPKLTKENIAEFKAEWSVTD